MEKHDFMFKLGQLIRSAREEKRLSQQQLADLLGKDQQAVQRIEKGKHEIGTFQLYELCEALGITMSDLLREIQSGS